MLHVFYVFSSVTAGIVPLIIQHLNFEPGEVLVITEQSQTSASVSSGLRCVASCLKPVVNRWKTLPKDWRNIFQNSQWIRRVTDGRKYTAHPPGPLDQYSQQILWHPLCRKYILFEEGIGSYCAPRVSPVQLTPLRPYQNLQLGRRFRGLGRVRPTMTEFAHWGSKYGGCFGSNELAFPNHPPPVVNLGRPLFAACPSPFTRVVIFDDFSVIGSDLHTAYLETIRDLVSGEHTGNDRWAYKLHPRCTEWPWLNEAVETIFRESLPPGTPFVKLVPDTSAEDIGIAEGVTTYGYFSSCLFYIHRSGGKVVSFKAKLEERHPGFRELWRKYFPPPLDELVSSYRQLA
jgi:hypothetical protein